MILCCAVLCCAVLHYTLPCFIALCYAGYLKDAEGPQQVTQLLCIELLHLGALQDLVPEGRHHGRHLVQEGGVRPHDVGDVLQGEILQAYACCL